MGETTGKTKAAYEIIKGLQLWIGPVILALLSIHVCNSRISGCKQLHQRCALKLLDNPHPIGGGLDQQLGTYRTYKIKG